MKECLLGGVECKLAFQISTGFRHGEMSKGAFQGLGSWNSSSVLSSKQSNVDEYSELYHCFVDFCIHYIPMSYTLLSIHVYNTFYNP